MFRFRFARSSAPRAAAFVLFAGTVPGKADEPVRPVLYDDFHEDFQFTRGGKLHGLAPENRVTGGNRVVPEGWSARVNFSGNGGERVRAEPGPCWSR